MTPYYQDDAVTLYHADRSTVTPITFYPCCEHCSPYPVSVYGQDGFPSDCELTGQVDQHRTPCRGPFTCRL